VAQKTGLIVLGTEVALLAALLVFNLAVAPPQGAPVQTLSGPLARVGSVVGQVEVRRGTSQRWDPLKPGDTLGEDDEVRTGLFSETTLYLRGASAVVVAPDSSFLVGQEVVERSSFKLGVGQIVAAIPRDANREYEFLSHGSDAVATSHQGEFSIINDGGGTVIVDGRDGQVTVQAAGKEVTVTKGRRSMVLAKQGPSSLLPVPSSLALQVKWPAAKLDRTQVTVSGKTGASALLLVNGILARADKDGNFSAEVSLREGSNKLVINATDGAGNAAVSESPEILVDTRPPEVRVDAEGLWK
jgi:hypothetical protein